MRGCRYAGARADRVSGLMKANPRWFVGERPTRARATFPLLTSPRHKQGPRSRITNNPSLISRVAPLARLRDDLLVQITISRIVAPTLKFQNANVINLATSLRCGIIYYISSYRKDFSIKRFLFKKNFLGIIIQMLLRIKSIKYIIWPGITS